MSALDDRRQGAIEAAYDSPHISDKARTSSAVRGMLHEAIETATRVRIDDEVMGAAAEFTAAPGYGKGLYRMLAAAFRAAGFEVEE